MKLSYAFARLLKHIRPNATQTSMIDEKANIGAALQIAGTHIGRYSYCGADCSIANPDIGGFTPIADHVVTGASAHAMDHASVSPVFYADRKPFGRVFWYATPHRTPRTWIGHDVRMGYSAKIVSGIAIGDGDVVAMGAVVTRDVMPYSILGGIPTKFIRERFPLEVAKELAHLVWWEWSEQTLQDKAHLFDDPRALIEAER